MYQNFMRIASLVPQLLQNIVCGGGGAARSVKIVGNFKTISMVMPKIQNTKKAKNSAQILISQQIP